MGACATEVMYAPNDIIVLDHTALPQRSGLHTIPAYPPMLSYSPEPLPQLIRSTPSLHTEKTGAGTHSRYRKFPIDLDAVVNDPRGECPALSRAGTGREDSASADMNGKRVGEGTRFLRSGSSRYM